MQIIKQVLKPKLSQFYIRIFPPASFMKSPSTASQEFKRYSLQNYNYLLLMVAFKMIHIDPNLVREQVHAMPAAFQPSVSTLTHKIHNGWFALMAFPPHRQDMGTGTLEPKRRSHGPLKHRMQSACETSSGNFSLHCTLSCPGTAAVNRTLI